MGTQPNVLELARQGNAKAIATLFNRTLQSHGITASARLKSDCLHIILEAAQVPQQQAMVRFVYNGMVKLKTASVRTIRIYGRQLGQDFPAWSNALVLPSHHWPKPSTPSPDFHPAPSKTPPPARKVNHLKPDRGHQKRNGLAAIAQPPTKIGSLSPEPNITEPNIKWNRFLHPLGPVLIAALAIQISFDGLLALFSLVGFTASAFYIVLDSWDTTGISISLVDLIVDWIEILWEPLSFWDGCLLWTTIGLFLIWLYRLQVRLKAAFPQYPITSWGAIARFALPFYNFWGIWNLLTTLANHLKSLNQTAPWGHALQRRLPWYYVTWLVLWILERTDWILGRLGIDPSLPLWFYLVLYVISLVLSILMLGIVWIIHRATCRLTLSQPPT